MPRSRDGVRRGETSQSEDCYQWLLLEEVATHAGWIKHHLLWSVDPTFVCVELPPPSSAITARKGKYKSGAQNTVTAPTSTTLSAVCPREDWLTSLSHRRALK